MKKRLIESHIVDKLQMTDEVHQNVNRTITLGVKPRE